MTASQEGTLDGRHSVLTPEYVEFDFVLAGLYSRLLAWLIDLGIVIALSVILFFLITLPMFAFPGFASALFVVVHFGVDWGYGVALETLWSGQTVGKRALGLRVIGESGVRIGFYQALLRNLARVVDRLPALYLVGGTVALFSRSHQRLGDMLAGTLVIRERRLAIPSGLARPEGELSLLADPLFRARALKLPREDQEVIFGAAIRREELGIDARIRLFAALGDRMEQQYGFVRPEHLSAEKLVLLIAAALAFEQRERTVRTRPPPPRAGPPRSEAAG
jgi:uncharacterized RDD family membrane protein YckC